MKPTRVASEVTVAPTSAVDGARGVGRTVVGLGVGPVGPVAGARVLTHGPPVATTQTTAASATSTRAAVIRFVGTPSPAGTPNLPWKVRRVTRSAPPRLRATTSVPAIAGPAARTSRGSRGRRGVLLRSAGSQCATQCSTWISSGSSTGVTRGVHEVQDADVRQERIDHPPPGEGAWSAPASLVGESALDRAAARPRPMALRGGRCDGGGQDGRHALERGFAVLQL